MIVQKESFISDPEGIAMRVVEVDGLLAAGLVFFFSHLEEILQVRHQLPVPLYVGVIIFGEAQKPS